MDQTCHINGPLNPLPENAGNDPLRTIYTTVPVSLAGAEPLPYAIDIDYTYFEVYVLLKDPTDQYFASVYEYFYMVE